MIDKGKTGKKIKRDNKDYENKQCSVNFNEHIEEDEFQIKLEHLNNIKKIKIEKLIEKYKTVFAKDKYDIGMVDYEARIELILDRYCSKRPYRCSIEKKKK